MISFFQTLSLQKKLLGGFLFVALICLLVGLTGMWGTAQLKQDMTIITEQETPALEAVLRLDKSLEQMKSSERTLLDGTLSFSQRQQEYQLLNIARTEAEQLISTLEQLPHAGEELQVWKSFLANWGQWQQQLQSFLALTKSFDLNRIHNPADLALQAQKMLASYQEWAIALSENIMDAVAITVEKDPLKTEIGVWVQGLESQNGDVSKAKEELINQLKTVSDSMVMIFDYFDIEEPELAKETYAMEIKPSVLGVKETIQHILAPIAQALEVQRQMQEHSLQKSAPVLLAAQQELQKMVAARRAAMSASSTQAAETSASVATVLWTIIAVGILAAVLLGFFLTRSITEPLAKTVNMLEELERGHIDERLNLQRGDEIGRMANAMDRFANSLQTEVVEPLQQLAHGDLTFKVSPRDERDLLRSTLQQLGADLNELIQQIQVAGEQITTGSSQVADSSASLSQGATESAASLEEISSSMNEIGAQTTHSAENANQANRLAEQAADAATTGDRQMNEMVAAMAEINSAGENINKIIKVIDEIAFQTNLLALNAAVEAARAGQHGKGFAVVAEEVRNLAARSAKAASETAELIEGSVEKAANGTEIAERTAQSLQGIVNAIGNVKDLVSEIAAASNEQANGVSQVNQGLQQIDQVIQQNTASAEESAATSEQLSGQAAHLQQMLQRFTLKTDQGYFTPPPEVKAETNGIEDKNTLPIGWTEPG